MNFCLCYFLFFNLVSIFGCHYYFNMYSYHFCLPRWISEIQNNFSDHTFNDRNLIDRDATLYLQGIDLAKEFDVLRQDSFILSSIITLIF